MDKQKKGNAGGKAGGSGGGSSRQPGRGPDGGAGRNSGRDPGRDPGRGGAGRPPPARAGGKPPKAIQADAPPRAPRPAAPGKARPEPVADDAREVRLHGINACLAFVEHRRDRIIRGYFSELAARRHFAPLMKWLAQQRLAYHLVTDAELERITGSAHHEGVCLLVRAEPPLAAADWLQQNRQLKRSCLLALENVGNPHNLGAILRTAAHFGIAAVLVPDAHALAGGAAVRTAEGGAEHVAVLAAPDFARTVQAFRAAGWRVVTTSSHQGTDLYRTALPEKCLVVFGEESAGLSRALLAAGDQSVMIPGTGKVESLNVSVAAAVLLGEWWRQHA